jgi:NADPH-dependent F420 reductase
LSRTIAIVGGTGPLGIGLALRWARAGENIVIGSRDAERAQASAAELSRGIENGGRLSGAENAAAVASADVAVLALPFAGHAALLKQLKPVLRAGTVLIDATVPLAASVGGRPTRTLGIWQGSAAEETAELAPDGVKVAAAFQNLSAESLNSDAPVDCDVIVCTDDAQAREVASELAEKIPGVRALNGGGLENARVLEQITALLITLNIRYHVHAAGVRITGLPNQEARSISQGPAQDGGTFRR